MKKGLLCLLAAALLVGCSNPSTSSSSSSSGDTPSSSENPSSSVPSGPNYTDSELAIIGSIIGNHAIPYIDFSQYDEDYSLGTTQNSQTMALGIGIQAYNFPVSDTQKIISTFTATGIWKDETEDQKAYYEEQGQTWPEGAYYLYGTYEDTSEMEIVLSVLNPETGQGIITEGNGLLQILIYPLVLATSEYVPGDINPLISELLGVSVTIPTPPKASYYMAYSLEDAAVLRLIDVDAVDSYASIFIEEGFEEISGLSENGRYLYSESNNLGVSLALDTSSGRNVTYCQFSLNSLVKDYPSSGIEAMASTIGGSDHSSIPAPQGDFVCYSLENGAAEFGYGFFYCYGENALEDYYSSLRAANWTDVGYFKEYGVPYWRDSKSTLILYARYDTTYEALVVGLVDIGEFLDMHKGWPSEVLASALTTLGSTSTLPTPSFAVSYSLTADYISSASYFYLAITNPDGKEEEGWTDVSSTYKEDLVKAGWAYDEVQDLYVSPDSNASVTIYHDEEGTIVIIQAYEGTLDSWPSEQVASARTAMSITSSLPEVTATGYRYIESRYENELISIEIDCFGLTEAQFTTYKEGLVALGYEESIFNGVSFLFTSDALITLSYTADRGLMTITLQNVSTIDISGRILNDSSIMATARTDAKDGNFILPSLPEGSIGVATYTNQINYAAFTVVVFDDAFMEAYAKVLVDHGWKVTEYEDAAPTYSYSTMNKTWYITMYSYPDENYSTLALTVDL